jgi:positive regulator of sigma E activity
MKNVISVKMTSNLLLLINAFMLVLHILIISKIVPHDFIWGGQIKNERDLIRLESVAILIQLVFIFIIALKAGYIFPGKLKRTANAGVWIIFIFMIINTFGNLASTSGLETLIMTPLTIVLALLTFRLGVEKKDHNNTISH